MRNDLNALMCLPEKGENSGELKSDNEEQVGSTWKMIKAMCKDLLSYFSL